MASLSKLWRGANRLERAHCRGGGRRDAGGAGEEASSQKATICLAGKPFETRETRDVRLTLYGCKSIEHVALAK